MTTTRRLIRICRSRGMLIWPARKAFALFLIATVAGCATQQPDERLHSTLWVQTSAEYAVATRQVFRMARDQIARDLATTASSRPLAVIVDVDQTILDNSGQTARSIIAETGFRPTDWTEWVNEASAPAVPGALEYLNYLAGKGVVVFYVTNRSAEKEPATRRNLELLGFPLDPDRDVIMTRLEQPDWTRDKTSRRQWLAARFEVLQVLGDELSDFISLPPGTDAETRVQMAESQSEKWGRQWFMLPNPIYGSWERALTPDGSSIYDSPMEQKIRSLKTQ